MKEIWLMRFKKLLFPMYVANHKNISPSLALNFPNGTYLILFRNETTLPYFTFKNTHD